MDTVLSGKKMFHVGTKQLLTIINLLRDINLILSMMNYLVNCARKVFLFAQLKNVKKKKINNVSAEKSRKPTGLI